jgi:Flp pilus assembly pilin Flp
MKTVLRFLRDEQGTETVEWAIIMGLIAVTAIVTIRSIGTKVKQKFTDLDSGLTP